MSDKTFVDGLIPKDAKPEWMPCKLSIKVEEFVNWLAEHDNNGWVNIDINRSKQGKLYATLNDWKPKKVDEPEDLPEQNFGKELEDSESLPF